MTPDAIAEALSASPSGARRWRAVCPAHQGSGSKSLLISARDDGSTQIKCFGGCTDTEVLVAAGLPERGNWKPMIGSPRRASTNPRHTKILSACRRELGEMQGIERLLGTGSLKPDMAAKKLALMAPSVLHVSPALPRHVAAAEEANQRHFWRLAIMLGMDLVPLLNIYNRPAIPA